MGKELKEKSISIEKRVKNYSK